MDTDTERIARDFYERKMRPHIHEAAMIQRPDILKTLVVWAAIAIIVDTPVYLLLRWAVHVLVSK